MTATMVEHGAIRPRVYWTVASAHRLSKLMAGTPISSFAFNGCWDGDLQLGRRSARYGAGVRLRISNAEALPVARIAPQPSIEKRGNHWYGGDKDGVSRMLVLW